MLRKEIRYFITLVLSLLFVLAFAACGGDNKQAETPEASPTELSGVIPPPSPESTTQAPPEPVVQEALTAEQVINYFALKDMPIGNVVIYTEETDPNNMLGRPGGYASKVNFEDERTLNEYTDTSSNAYKPNNTLEVFITEEDAKARYDYVETVTKGLC